MWWRALSNWFNRSAMLLDIGLLRSLSSGTHCPLSSATTLFRYSTIFNGIRLKTNYTELKRQWCGLVRCQCQRRQWYAGFSMPTEPLRLRTNRTTTTHKNTLCARNPSLIRWTAFVWDFRVKGRKNSVLLKTTSQQHSRDKDSKAGKHTRTLLIDV